jgi:uncharacterized protein YutE (UPF0331/DUF86 family)
MDELWEEIETEKQLIEKTLAELEKGLQRSERSYLVLAGMAALVHNIYTGIENIIKRTLVAKGKTPDQRSPFWHQDLLDTAKDEKIISEELAATLREYLGFRHFFVHAYGVLLKPEKLSPLANNAAKLWQAFYSEIISAYQALKQ